MGISSFTLFSGVPHKGEYRLLLQNVTNESIGARYRGKKEELFTND